MPNLQARGVAALIRRMKQTNGLAVTYTRGAQSVSITAWTGNTLFARNVKDPGAPVVWGEGDVLFAAADLVIDGENLTPQKGDTITLTLGGSSVTFGLSTPTGEPVWRYADQTRMIIRVHCKEVEVS